MANPRISYWNKKQVVSLDIFHRRKTRRKKEEGEWGGFIFIIKYVLKTDDSMLGESESVLLRGNFEYMSYSSLT